MGCGCAKTPAATNSLFTGGKRRGKKTIRRSRSRSRSRRISNKSRSRSRSKSRSKTRSVMRGGMNFSLLGDQATNPLNYLQQVLGAPGVPSMPWNHPANVNYGSSNKYVV
jgi:hypothetical protein